MRLNRTRAASDGAAVFLGLSDLHGETLLHRPVVTTADAPHEVILAALEESFASDARDGAVAEWRDDVPVVVLDGEGLDEDDRDADFDHIDGHADHHDGEFSDHSAEGGRPASDPEAMSVGDLRSDGMPRMLGNLGRSLSGLSSTNDDRQPHRGALDDLMAEAWGGEGQAGREAGAALAGASFASEASGPDADSSSVMSDGASTGSRGRPRFGSNAESVAASMLSSVGRDAGSLRRHHGRRPARRAGWDAWGDGDAPWDDAACADAVVGTVRGCTPGFSGLAGAEPSLFGACGGAGCRSVVLPADSLRRIIAAASTHAVSMKHAEAALAAASAGLPPPSDVCSEPASLLCFAAAQAAGTAAELVKAARDRSMRRLRDKAARGRASSSLVRNDSLASRSSAGETQSTEGSQGSAELRRNLPNPPSTDQFSFIGNGVGLPQFPQDDIPAMFRPEAQSAPDASGDAEVGCPPSRVRFSLSKHALEALSAAVEARLVRVVRAALWVAAHQSGAGAQVRGAEDVLVSPADIELGSVLTGQLVADTAIDVEFLPEFDSLWV